jgi:hypothetical protein
MGDRPAHLIEKAAMYLISVLMTTEVIDYDYFYDGEEKTFLRLIEGLGITRVDADWYCAEALMDNAVYELEEQGMVRREWLASTLVDGEPNYRIILTAEGKEKLCQGVKLTFYPIE